ncbi:biotin transport system substrate-specific component [Ruminococcaceae bacterium YRB3002]|nr:biotin transport system substrate-specific component [Ruminococcaceae bacterium YRB3002]
MSVTRQATYDLVLEAIGAAIIVVGSFISVNLSAVPFTLQTLAVMAVLMTLGGKRGTISIICYLLMGTVGLPVFAGMKGGPYVILGPTGGFLAGFILVGFIYWVTSDRWFRIDELPRIRRIAAKTVLSIVCLAVLYAVGVVWFMYIYAHETGEIGLASAVSLCVVPFILPDIAKLIAAVAISEACRKIVKAKI